jgi:hypothetical protein
MLLVQKYLETHTFGELAAEHGVYASFSKSGHKFSLNYDQIEAKESDPLAQECRGLILSLEDGTPQVGIPNAMKKLNFDHICPGKTKVLAFPMKRFFNYGQGAAADVNWNDPSLKVLEKLDGTLCIVYWDPFIFQWCVATRSVPEADLFMDNGIFTFRTLFEKAVKDTCKFEFADLQSYLDKSYTYCFELTTPYNRIVVDYKTCGITLLAARNMKTLNEEVPNDLGIVTVIGVPVVKSFSFNNVNELIDWVSSQNPMEYEGVVVRDGNFNRLKVKNAAYVAYNKVRDTLAASERNCVELILAEKDDDVVAFLPEEIVKNLQKIKAGVQVAIKRHDEAYKAAVEAANTIAPGDKKTFAILITKQKDLWTAPFFQMFDGKASNMKDFIQKNKKDGTWANSFLDKILEIASK